MRYKFDSAGLFVKTTKPTNSFIILPHFIFSFTAIYFFIRKYPFSLHANFDCNPRWIVNHAQSDCSDGT